MFGNNSEDPTDEPLPSIYNTKSILKTTVHEGHNVISFHLTTPKGVGEVAEVAEVTGLVLLNGNPCRERRSSSRPNKTEQPEVLPIRKGGTSWSSPKRDPVPWLVPTAW
ncbi:MAG: hypothetical protein CM1200mP2_15860 [Planctomycetaceae bacterium]|nr:MAG: hypothetical protein CM1200mP2_15860 [Planctomycetaceae bacterium]